jgi:hypothetical protein
MAPRTSTSATTTATAITFDTDTVVQLASALKQLETAQAAAAPQRPQILVRVSRRVITEKELENVGAADKANGIIAKISHSELSQNRLITTVVDSSEMSIQDVVFTKGDLADYRCIIPMTDTSINNPIIKILADIDMSFHAMKDGQALDGGGISFAVAVEADYFDIEEAVLDGKMEVVPYGNIKISAPQALPSSRKLDLKAKMAEVKASKAKQAAEASTIRDTNRRNRLGTTTDAIVNSALQDAAAANIPSMEELATADA